MINLFILLIFEGMERRLIFARVSKREQDYQRQIEDLRTIAKAKGVKIVQEISENIRRKGKH